MIEDRRKYVRADFDCEILYPVVVQGDKRQTYKDEHHLFATDISETGICVESNFPIPIDSFLSFYLRIQDNLPFRCLVKLRWSKTYDDHYAYGGEFVALSLDDINTIRKYINSIRQKQ